MKTILILFYFWYGAGSSGQSIEFASHEACVSAAEKITEKTRKNILIYVCVPEYVPPVPVDPPAPQ